MVKAHDDTGIFTRQLMLVLNINMVAASGALSKLCDRGFLIRENVLNGSGLRYRYWACGTGPQPFHGGANSRANAAHRGERHPTADKKKQRAQTMPALPVATKRHPLDMWAVPSTIPAAR